jgi:hypothetical protein
MPPPETAFAPYRLAPGALPEEAVRSAAETAAEPLVAGAGEPLPGALVNTALADIPAGRAAAGDEACRAADGSVAGGGGPPRACLSSPRHRARVAEASRAALTAGFAGICLDRPDAPLALGLLGAGFCPDCQRDLARHLAREYGETFQPVDYLALARAAIAQASGAISFEQLPFGRDFWRVRNDALPRRLGEYARDARDAARAAGRPFQIVAQFEHLGHAQLRAAWHLDAAIFPAQPAPGLSGIGLARLLRGAMGRRPCAVAPAAAAPAALARTAAIFATCAVELSGVEPAGDGGRELAAIRRLGRRLAKNGLSALACVPVAECALLFSAEADLWSGGRHRAAVERAAEALAALHVQAPVVMRVEDAPPGAALVLAGAEALSALEAKRARRRLESGGALLAFGEPQAVDEVGRAAAPFLPGGKPGGSKVGEGTLAVLPSLWKDGKPVATDPAVLDRALSALLGRGRRAASVAGRAPPLVVLHRGPGALLAHLVAPDGERTLGATLFLGAHVAGGARSCRFVSADGQDVRIPLNPSGMSVSTVLPSFRGYAVLSVTA